MCQLCFQWLSNHGGGGMFQSPAFSHLSHAKHENLTLQNDVQLGTTAFECHSCGQKNGFVLGFIPVKADSIAVVLGRKFFNEQYSTQWNELVQDRCFLSFLVENQRGNQQNSPQTETNSSKPFTAHVDNKVDSETILERYENGRHYQNVFAPLLHSEAEYEKHLAESTRTQNNVLLRWEVQSNKKVIAYFNVEQSDTVWKLMRGDELRLKHPRVRAKPWTGVGRVIEVSQYNGGEVGLEMSTNVNIPFKCTNNFSVHYIWNSVAFDRMQSALEYFAVDSSSQSNHIYNRILGLDTTDVLFEPRDFKLYSVPKLPTLTQSQVSVVKRAIQRPLPLIKGPPGTGKTVTALSILYHLVKQTEGPVLVCAPSNVAVDQLTKSIHKIGLKVVRLFAESRESVSSPVAFLGLNSQIEELNPELLQLSEKSGTISAEYEKQLRVAKKKVELEILNTAEVICCTCIGAGDARLIRMKFRAIIIDECMQATEPECIVPLMLGSKQLILVGDQFGLGPVVKCEKAQRHGLSRSLFKRLDSMKLHTFTLTDQYRMHPELSRLPSTLFYDGCLQDGVRADERKLPAQVFPWPVPDKPVMFYVVRDREEQIWPDSAYINRAEASIVEKITTYLLRRGITPEQIGIITPYGSQRNHIALCMENRGPLDLSVYKQIEKGKVDAFQGREKDIIIISCTRSDGVVGCLNDVNRLNLVLTRARYGLIILGNPAVLSKLPQWSVLLNFFRNEKVMVEELIL